MITYYRDKGCPLTIEELDNNFNYLQNKMDEIENNINKTENLTKIEQNGNDIIFYSNHGYELGKINLPTISWNFTGDWKDNTRYNKFDVINKISDIYYTLFICTDSHDGSLDFDIKFWQEIIKLPIINNRYNFYTIDSLPADLPIGTVSITNRDNTVVPVYFDGKHWRYISDSIKCIATQEN